MAGCVLAVSLSSSSVPSKHIFEIENPSALSASSKTALAAGYLSASSLPMPGYCEACPGKTNATLPIVIPCLAPSREDRGGGELLFNFLVHARAGKSRSHANGVFHGVGVRTPMTDHTNAADAQQRRAAVLRIINRLPQRLESSLRKHSPHLRKERTIDRLPQQPKNLKRQAFANLQRDVADKAVADDDIHAARKKIPAFHISHEVYRTLLQPCVNLARQFIALDLFFTDREQAHARTLAAKRRAVIDFAHHCKLHKMLRLRIHIRAHVQEHGDAALGVGKRSCQRDAIHRFQRSEQKLRDGHDRAGVSRADHA